jgi:hypothetical protein
VVVADQQSLTVRDHDHCRPTRGPYESAEIIVRQFQQHDPIATCSSFLATALPVIDPVSGGVRSVIGISRIAVPEARMYVSAILATASRPCDGAGTAPPDLRFIPIQSRGGALLIAFVEVQEQIELSLAGELYAID